MKKPELKAETCNITNDWYVCFHYFGQGWEKIRDFTHVWKTVCMHAQVWSLFHVANQQSGRNQVVGCNHNHHRKLQSASMLSDGNFYFIQPFYSRLFLDYIRLIPSSFLLRYNDVIKNFRGVVTWPWGLLKSITSSSRRKRDG